MSIYPFLIPRPFTDGYVPDLPVEMLGPKMAARLDEAMFPRGVTERRRGWTYDGTTADVAAVVNQSFARVNFQRAVVTRNLVTTAVSSGSNLYIHNPAGAGTLIVDADAGLFSGTSSPVFLPRCVYRDELIFCAQNGLAPLVRYAGLSATGFVTPATAAIAAGESRFTWAATGLTADFSGGGFLNSFLQDNAGVIPLGPRIWCRILLAKNTALSVTVEGMRASAAYTIAALGVAMFGFASACVPVYVAGTFTASGSTITGQGTAWNTSPQNVFPDAGGTGFNGDGFLEIQPSTASSYLSAITNVSADTTLTTPVARPAVATPSPYAIVRRMPFKDATAFRGCLFGCGVYGRDSTLWYTPPGADISYYPKQWAGANYDPSVALTSTNPRVDFQMEFVEVPSYYDSDPLVALLATRATLFVVKRGSVYSVTGDYPTFRIDKVADDAGCLDIRSAITDEYGVFWAGDSGVWTVRDGTPYNLCGAADRPGIITEWRNLLKEGVAGPVQGSTSWISCGIGEGHLIVSVRTASATERCYVYDLKHGVWCGKFTNTLPRHMWSSRIPGEADKLYGVQDLDIGRAVELSSIFRSPAAGASGAGLGVDGDGVAPLLVAHTGSRVFFPQSESNEGRLTDLKLTVKAYDTATPSTTITPTIVHGDGYDATVDTTTALAGFDADTTNVAHTKIYRPGTRGRRQQLQVVQTDQDAEFSTLEIHELAGTVRTYSRRR